MNDFFKERIVAGTKDRINEAIYNYHRLHQHYEKSKDSESFDIFMVWLDEFRYLFNSYLISVMSIKPTLDKDYIKIEGYEIWWSEKITEIKRNSQLISKSLETLINTKAMDLLLMLFPSLAGVF